MGVVSEVDGSDGHGSLHFFVFVAVALQVVWEGVVHRPAVVSAQAYAQSGYGVVVDARCKAVLVGHLKLKRRARAVLNPVVAVEKKAVQAGDKLYFIPEIARTAPETDAGVVPGAGQYGCLALRTVDGEEVERFVVGVGETHGNDKVAHADFGPAGKRLLYPELLQFHFASLLGLLLPFAGFLELFLNGSSGPTVLKLNLARHCPAFAEVVAYIHHGMRNVKPAVAGGVLVFAGLAVPVDVVAVEVARKGHFTVAAYAQAVASLVG